VQETLPPIAAPFLGFKKASRQQQHVFLGSRKLPASSSTFSWVQESFPPTAAPFLEK
jgi:hypothetical protein